jgi:hypothetical protein
MPEVQEAPTPLSPEESMRLIEFARALKAAARVVTLYPGGHPAIAVTLGRIVEMTSSERLPEPLRITVLPDNLLLDERPPARADTAVTELAELLHSHVIGALTISGGGDVEAWRNFLLLLGRTPETLRSEGGIARVWATTAGQHLELREIDYAQVLRERKAGKAAVWDRVIANCLQGDTFDLDEEAIRELLEIAGNSEQLAELVTELETRAGDEGGLSAKATAVLRMLQTIVEAASKVGEPEHLEPVLRNMAGAVGQLTPDTLIDLLAKRGGTEEGPRLMNAVVGRMTDKTIAQFVARNVIEAPTSTDRLAVAFQALVKGKEDRTRMLALAHKDVAESPLGNTEGFEGVWDHVAEKLLTSYSDKSFVTEEYGRELSSAGTRAIDVEHSSDDPPERVSAWLSTVATPVLQTLDLTLMLDLLRIEENDERWGGMTTPAVALIEELLFVGDFDAAVQLVGVLTQQAAAGASQVRRQHAVTAIDMLVAGPMMRNIVTHLTTIDEQHFEQVKAMCLSLGEVVVKPLAEALSVEERVRPRQRLTTILIAFGVVGKRTAERLKSSPNAAVRRTAVYLLREFGGSDALPDLTELLDDNEPQVQREAVRAILNIGTEQSYQVLETALASGTDRSREAIMQAVIGLRDERAAPLFTYIIRHVNHRGPLVEVYLRAIEALGALRNPEGVIPLREALYRGEWWAPRRNTVLRSAAAEALARIGTPEARAVLDDAASSGPRGVRTVVRAQLNASRRSRERGAQP